MMKMVFTVTEVAKICQVAPATVRHWFDRGLLKGYVIPGGRERRIPRQAFVRFYTDHGFPKEWLDEFDRRWEAANPEG